MAEAVISRRTVLKRGLGTAAGTALGGLAALGTDLRPAQARAATLKIADTRQYPSVCPYCAVGCDTVVHVSGEGENKRIVNIEGDVRSPVSGGNLCPKGAATYQLHINPNRLEQVLHRAPGATSWEVMDLETAMDRVAELTKQARDETFVETETVTNPDGTTTEKLLNHSLGIFSLGGATMDNEWNHIQQKLMRGLGVVAIENQARI